MGVDGCVDLHTTKEPYQNCHSLDLNSVIFRDCSSYVSIFLKKDNKPIKKPMCMRDMVYVLD